MSIATWRDKIYTALLPLAGSGITKPMTEIYKYAPKKWDNPPFMIIQYDNTANETEDSCSNNLTYSFILSIVHLINDDIDWATAEQAICNIIDLSIGLLNDNRAWGWDAVATIWPTSELVEITASEKWGALVGRISVWIKSQDVLS